MAMTLGFYFGGSPTRSRSDVEEVKKPEIQSSDHITLKSVGFLSSVYVLASSLYIEEILGESEQFFTVKRKAKLRKMMTAYCISQGVDLGYFQFTFDGDHIRPDQTPDQLKLEDGDEIDAHSPLIGGSNNTMA